MSSISAQPGPGSGPYKSRPHNRSARIKSNLLVACCMFSALITIAALAAIIGYVFYQGFTTLVIFNGMIPQGINWPFFTHLPLDEPTGMRNAIEGTVILVALAGMAGVPIGMLCGIYLSEFSRENWFTQSVRVVADVLGGTPTILIGVLVYQLVVVPMHGNSAVAGSIALAFIMVPIIARTTEEMLKLVPKAHREASVGLGASRFQTLFRVVLPAARSGIITGVMLAIARIAGETAPLLFTAGDSDLTAIEWRRLLGVPLPVPVLTAHPFPSLTAKIYFGVQDFRPDVVQQGWAGMLVLISIILMLNASVRYVSRKKKGAR